MPKYGGRERKLFGIGLGTLSVGAIASVAAGGYKMAEFLVHLKKLHEVSGENKVFVRLHERARLDLAETERLLYVKEVKHALSRSPEKVRWIRTVIVGMRIAIEQMAEFTESVAGKTQGGRHLGIRSRLKWVLDSHEKLVHRQMEVNLAHQSLLEVLGFLAALEPLACCKPNIGRAEVDWAFLEAGRQRRGEKSVTFEEDEKTVRVSRGGREEEPERETIRVRGEKRRSFGREGPDRETIRVHEEKRRSFGREEPERETIRLRESRGRDEPVKETIRVREKKYYGRDEPTETVRVRERSYSDRGGPIRMEDNENRTQYSASSYSSSSSDRDPRARIDLNNLPPIRAQWPSSRL